MKLFHFRDVCTFSVVFLIFFLILEVNTSQLHEKQQEIQEEAIAINVEVPVRVFKGSKFVDNLTIDDFRVYEDGILQKIVALYFIKKTIIERKEIEEKEEEPRKEFAPETVRQFVLLFELIDYMPKLEEALDYFIHNVFAPGDSLMVVTPLKFYNFKHDAWRNLTKERIIEQLKTILRKDITMGQREYKNLVWDIIDLLQEPQNSVDQFRMERVKILLERLVNLRDVGQKRLLEFADFLKKQEGQKHVFLFYQKEILPIPEGAAEELLTDLIMLGSFDTNKVKQAYADSLITIHFLYLTKTKRHMLDGKTMSPLRIKMVAKHRDDIFSTFKDLAQTTGGFIESSANIASSFQKAAEASENYYLLYYAPKNYKADGKFKKIKVEIKNKNYRVLHRVGYFAD
ncbi:MAG: hypothetical protein ACE5L7_04570 [Candidatus Aminicenantales bacterium]